MYTVDNLRNAIKACRKNIDVFNEAAEKERETIAEYQRQIKHIQEQESIKNEVYDHVEVQVVKDDCQN